MIKVIHFVSAKPWDLIGQSKNRFPVAFKLWFDVYKSDRNAIGIFAVNCSATYELALVSDLNLL